MDAKDFQIAASVCVKAAAELFGGSGDASRALGAAEEFYAWIIEKSNGAAPARGGEGGPVHPTPAPAPPSPTEACPKCGGPIFNNYTENLKRAIDGKKPLPVKKCKNKDGCGWLQWN